LYQKSPDHTELWQWNPVTREANRALISAFTPVGFALLPDNAGFSFFDNGRLHIKNFLKRSPKAIDIYEPIYDLGQFTWLTSDLALFHAKEREKFSLYTLCASDGTVTKVVENKTCDCFYASLISSSLWYLTRNKQTQEHALMQCSYLVHSQASHKATPGTAESSFPTASRIDLSNHQKILSYKGSLAFLTMLNEKEGIVIEHQSQVDPHTDTILSCMCYRILCDTFDQWSLNQLFSFSLPLSLLLPSSKTRLSESIYPLLPRVCGKAIHFVTFLQGELHPYMYQEGVGVKESILNKKESSLFTDLFPPYVLEDKGLESSLVYGGCLQSQDVRSHNLQLDDFQSNDWLENGSNENGNEAAEYLIVHTT